jgi:hypothetical protein
VYGNNSDEINRAQLFILNILDSGQCFILNFTNFLPVFANKFIEINSPQFYFIIFSNKYATSKK